MLDIVSTRVEVETCTDDAATAVLLNGEVDVETVLVLSPEEAAELSEGDVAIEVGIEVEGEVEVEVEVEVEIEVEVEVEIEVEVEVELGEVETIGLPSDEAAVVPEGAIVFWLLS